VKIALSLALLLPLLAEAQTQSEAPSSQNQDEHFKSVQLDLPKIKPVVPTVQDPPSAPAVFLLQKKTENPRVPKQPWIVLSLAVYAAAAWDMHGTEYSAALYRKNPGLFPGGYFEADPLARPFTRLPAPAYYATGFALATGVNWLSWRMGRSPRMHRIWWLPQALSIIGNAQGVGSYYSNYRCHSRTSCTWQLPPNNK
jgi:hypothetical protein